MSENANILNSIFGAQAARRGVCPEALGDGIPLSADERIERDERFMRLALKEARAAADKGEVPIGAVVVRDGQVIARAHNQREATQDPSSHAEFTAMLKASCDLGEWRLTGCTVYVTVEPCIMCAGLMHQARVSRCVYGAPDPKAGALGSLYRVHADERLNHTFEVQPGVLQDECAQIISDFFAARRGKGTSRGNGES